MELELSFKYQGAVIEGTAFAEEDYNGWKYEITLKDNKSFRMYCDDNEETTVAKTNGNKIKNTAAKSKIFN